MNESKNYIGMETIELTKSGFAGLMPNGNIVDRRKFPDAIPIKKNSMFETPEPIALNKDNIDPSVFPLYRQSGNGDVYKINSMTECTNVQLLKNVTRIGKIKNSLTTYEAINCHFYDEGGPIFHVIPEQTFWEKYVKAMEKLSQA